MSHLIGRRGHAREAYPISSGVGSGNASLDQAAWFIDGQNVSGNASNGNRGDTALAPILTHTEFRRRIGFGQLQQATTITIMSDLQDTDVLDTGYSAGLFPVSYVGALTTVRPTDTILAYTDRNPATNTPNSLTSTAAAAWNTFVGGGQILRMTSGPASGFGAYVAVNTGVNQCRLSSVFDSVNFVETQPVAGNTFIIQRMTRVPQAIFGGQLDATFTNLYFLGANDPFAFGRVILTVLDSIFWLFGECAFESLHCSTGNGAALVNCQYNQAVFILQSPMFLDVGLMLDPSSPHLGSVVNGNTSTFVLNMLMQGASWIGNLEAAIGFVDDVGFFDHTGRPSFQLINASTIPLGTVWGGVAGQFGCVLDKTALLQLSGTGQTINSGDVAHQVNLPVTGAVTWAAARAGIKDAATSAATTMPVT